jgi:beta-ribofuranosylaminobenzene 5'-phosphate synthase
VFSKIVVKAPARLHLGILDMKGDLGRIYGSIGVALEKPKTVVEIARSDRFKILGLDGFEVDIEDKILGFLSKLNLKPKVKIRVLNTAPLHVGLGSVTQLLLSIGFGLVKLFNLKISVEDVAKLMGRGDVSGIGTYAFKFGGFLVDGGRKTEGFLEIPPLLFRFDFPKSWIFVLGIPNIKRGFDDETEKVMMVRARESLKNRTVSKASRIVLMKLLPSLLEKNIVEFGKALLMLQFEVGKMFSEVQGGVFRHPVIQHGIDFLLKEGVYGGGQSSWGPTFYGLVEGKVKAKNLADKLTSFLGKECGGGLVFSTTANNSGAKVLVYK